MDPSDYYRTGQNSTYCLDGYVTDIYVENPRTHQGELFRAVICLGAAAQLIFHESHAEKIEINLKGSKIKNEKISVRDFNIKMKVRDEEDKLFYDIPVQKNGQGEVSALKGVSFDDYFYKGKILK